MAGYVKIAGAWNEFTPYVKIGGVWQECNDGYAKVAGVQQQWYNPVPPVTYDLSFLNSTNCSDLSSATGFYSVLVRFQDSTNGQVNILRTVQPDVTPAGDYTSAATGQTLWVRAVTVSGSSTVAGGSNAMDTWLQLDTTKQFFWTYTSSGGNDFRTFTVRFEIAATSGGTPLATSSDIVVSIGENF